jgi:hypothetical protein
VEGVVDEALVAGEGAVEQLSVAAAGLVDGGLMATCDGSWRSRGGP